MQLACHVADSITLYSFCSNPDTALGPRKLSPSVQVEKRTCPHLLTCCESALLLDKSSDQAKLRSSETIPHGTSRAWQVGGQADPVLSLSFRNHSLRSGRNERVY